MKVVRILAPVAVVVVLLIVAAFTALHLVRSSSGEELATVNTNFRMGGSDKLSLTVYDDEAVRGVSCYISRPETGGWKGTVGMAEDKSDASISCVATGKIEIPAPLPQQADVFNERLSVGFKTLHVIRVVDRKRNTLTYWTHSDHVLGGSPKNDLSVVPVPASTPIPVR
ncbi:CreA family protein [Paraburkholderia sp. UCT31]|uniref:CreA family protein n=1 Tax=Paraburkholderia sp. UCT31 TaxID=2615209 RepID=UPI00165635B8|nr:CreA family protein [Paraburkholderia sp. UCT31]MBC8737405.1 CreA family protein [Paraburkholderia sp. UCT31]